MKLHEAIVLVLESPASVALYHPCEKRLYMHDISSPELFDGTRLWEADVFRPLLRVDGRFVVRKECVAVFGVDDFLFDGWAVILCDLRDVKEQYGNTNSLTRWAKEEDVEALGRVLTYYSPTEVFYHHATRSEK